MNDVHHAYIYAGRGEGKENAWSASLVARIDGTYSTHFGLLAAHIRAERGRRRFYRGTLKSFRLKTDADRISINRRPFRARLPFVRDRECINPRTHIHIYICAGLRELLQ